MTNNVTNQSDYRKTPSFGLASLVYYATVIFCKCNSDNKNNLSRKIADQMVSAARSARQKIMDATALANNAKETQLRLLDKAKTLLNDLVGDFEMFLLTDGNIPWSENDATYVKVQTIVFDVFEKKNDLRHEFGRHLLEMRARFGKALENSNSTIAANAILATIDRVSLLLSKQIEEVGEVLRKEGLSRVQSQDEYKVPRCPKCGGPMRKAIAKKGANAGNPFWSCQAYPNCNGTKKWEWKS
jgi:hypothetical protein